MLTSLKLVAGQAWVAWRRYPALRRSLGRPRPGPPVLVTGAYRTGTTWVGAMLATAGLWPLHEPFNPNRGLWSAELDYVTGEDRRSDVDRLVATLLRGGHREVVRLPHADRWFSPHAVLPSTPRRVLLKDPSAALLSEYLVRRHRMRALVVYRHPVAVAASFVRLGWPTGDLVGRLLDSTRLMEDWLAPRADRMESALGRRDWTAGAVLYASLATVLVGLEGRNPGAMNRLSFEDLCRDPVGSFRALHRLLELPWDDEIARSQAALTGGEESREERPYGVRRRSAELADGWRREVAESDVASVRAVWEEFDVPLYRGPGDWPRGGGP